MTIIWKVWLHSAYRARLQASTCCSFGIQCGFLAENVDYKPAGK